MPVRSRRPLHSRVRASVRSPGAAKYSALIATRLDDLESSIVRVRSGRAKPRLTSTSAGGRRVTLSTVADSLKSTNIHSIVEKAATATVVTADVIPYMKNQVVCPSGGTTFADSYTVSDAQTKPVCKTTGGGSGNGHILPADTSN